MKPAQSDFTDLQQSEAERKVADARPQMKKEPIIDQAGEPEHHFLQTPAFPGRKTPLPSLAGRITGVPKFGAPEAELWPGKIPAPHPQVKNPRSDFPLPSAARP
ncbi:MAG: hypothetical protein D6679_02995 [Candidatus Hydrogenedentota bacterium]|nr:MAG: hypothetical protein D6679_02995 [Candidatus Hydrogenedentota bacterium]